ncbi:class III signal peptide-containing protein [Methanobacterium paludis]|uniref:Class III signal peptide-containing protein n=1 Tax=Methanobacterium paludis (strain DSM 25820 / JCM 18151 / SWAN1) TaxID=868131 RepID=F6D6D6_METPW|nr:class III signal peptide-containing protein [Methanobacterium paludis]AEG18957.1 hypothetical protein MSWAN_1948 [Methanobacterium paludis]
MGILKEESAQTSAELILIVGGIIVIAIVAAIFYKNYVNGLGNEINNTDVANVNNNITDLKNEF